METWARHRYEDRVRRLEGFVHRGSATSREREAADYLVDEFATLGLAPQLESFAGYRSFGARMLLPVAMAAAGATLLLRLPLVASALGMVALASLIVEQSARGVVLSWLLPRARSQNVTATLAAGPATPRARLVVLGHYDTQRTGLLFREAVWRRVAPLQRRLPAVFQSPLLPVTLAMAAQAVFGVVGGVIPTWSPPTALVIGLLAVYICAGAVLAEWAFRSHVPGASDNASGAAGVLALAEEWCSGPVDGIEVVCVLTGCEEVGLVGAVAWTDRHRADIRAVPTVFLNLDGLGFGPPHLLGQEVPAAGLPVRYPPDLVATGVEVARECGIADTGPITVPGYTDGLALLVRGVPGLTVVGCQSEGWLPNWHLPTDVSEQMDFDGAWRGVELATRLSRRLVGLPALTAPNPP